MSEWIPLSEVADDLEVSRSDVWIVAESELHDDCLYDPEQEAVSPAGRDQLKEHFQGGSDPR